MNLLTPKDRKDVKEYLTVAANHIREVVASTPHGTLNKMLRAHLLSLASRADELRKKIGD